MKCQKCGINEATAHVKQMVNGDYSEMRLCSECAEKIGFGYNNMFSDFQNEFSNLLGSFFGNALPARTQASRCSKCGATYAEIAQSGMVGCANCYDEFFDQLLPSIKKIHGNTTHCGKKAKQNFVATEAKSESKVKEPTVEEMQKELEEAVKVQNFERAAEIRDLINAKKKA